MAQVHFGVRARRDERHALHMLLASVVMMVCLTRPCHVPHAHPKGRPRVTSLVHVSQILIGVGLGCISASITLAESQARISIII